MKRRRGGHDSLATSISSCSDSVDTYIAPEANKSNILIVEQRVSETVVVDLAGGRVWSEPLGTTCDVHPGVCCFLIVMAAKATRLLKKSAASIRK